MLWPYGLVCYRCVFFFFKKKKKKKPVTDKVSHCARYFFPLVISATDVFSPPTQLLSFLIFTLSTSTTFILSRL